MASYRAITGMVKTNVHDHHMYRIRMGELESLLRSLGYTILERIIQVRRKEAVDYVFGKGKVEEIRERVRQLDPDVFVLYNTLTSKQKWNLERKLGVEVIDRYDVTLMIFREAASDILSKLQIELATLEKAFPYVKLSASIKYKRMRAGFRGGGEYAYHRQIRAIQRRMKILRRKIDKLSRQKELEIMKRLKDGASIVVLTGYYNAGKTSLFNALTGFEKPVSDMPFTTLSSKYGGIEGASTYVVDTIGFVLDLDPRLIASFQLNLLDIKHSHRQVLVVDVSDKPELMRVKVKESLKILAELGKGIGSLIVAANKVDLLEDHEYSPREKILTEVVGRDVPVIPVSAKERIGLRELVSEIVRRPELELAR
mgnify:CR=1 FL=1